jgi:hypothetical protein
MSDESELQAEFGSNGGALFINATAFDSEGNEVEIPICNRCTNGYRTMLIGKEYAVWVCSCGAVI